MSEKYVTPAKLPNDHEREMLTIFIEECAEAQKRATKMLRFGRDEVQPEHAMTNRERLSIEIGDVSAMIDKLQMLDLIDTTYIRIGYNNKNRQLGIFSQTERVNG